MIFYFSGTGNSAYVAKTLSELLGESLHFIPKTAPEGIMPLGSSLGFVFPVYSWGVPPIVLDFIDRLGELFMEEANERQIPVWAVLTCGDETGLAPEMLEKALHHKGLDAKGIWSVIMPNNYVLLPGFDIDSKGVEARKLEEAPSRIRLIGEAIKSGRWVRDYNAGPHPALKTRLVYPLFRRWGINARKWRWTEECIGCGKCAAKCPVENIGMVNGHPRWGANCVSCLACYHVCPTHAVEYGRATRHKGRYFCKKTV